MHFYRYDLLTSIIETEQLNPCAHLNIHSVRLRTPIAIPRPTSLVGQPPQFVQPLHNAGASDGQKIKLECRVTGQPHPQVVLSPLSVHVIDCEIGVSYPVPKFCHRFIGSIYSNYLIVYLHRFNGSKMASHCQDLMHMRLGKKVH